MGGVIKKVMMSQLEEALERMEARALNAEAKLGKANADLVVAASKARAALAAEAESRA